MSTRTLDEFMSVYNTDGTHPVVEVDLTDDDRAASTFIVIRHGRFAAIVNPLTFEDYLDLDVHPFVDDKDAMAGVMGMVSGTMDKPGGSYGLEETGTRVEPGWNAASLIAVFIGDKR